MSAFVAGPSTSPTGNIIPTRIITALRSRSGTARDRYANTSELFAAPTPASARPAYSSASEAQWPAPAYTRLPASATSTVAPYTSR